MSSIKKGCQEKNSPSTEVGIGFSRSSPLPICLAVAVLPFHSDKLLLVPGMTPLSWRRAASHGGCQNLVDFCQHE